MRREPRSVATDRSERKAKPASPLHRDGRNRRVANRTESLHKTNLVLFFLLYVWFYVNLHFLKVRAASSLYRFRPIVMLFHIERSRSGEFLVMLLGMLCPLIQ